MLLLIPIVAVLVGDLWVLTSRTRTTTVTLEDALTDYRERPEVTPTTARPTTGETTSTPPASPAGAGAPDGRDETPLPSDTQVAPASSPTTVTTTAPATEPSGPEGWRRPDPGVYTYHTGGFETLALGSARHDFPEETQAILRHADSCDWQLEHQVVEEHVDTFDLCSADSEQTWYRWRIERTFLENTLVFDYRCTGDTAMLREGRSPGDVFEATCDTGEGEQADATFRYRRNQRLDIGGTRVGTARFHVDIVLSGDVEGSVTADLWIDRATGMRVREERVVDNTVPTPLGRADYHEELTVELRSLMPTT